MEGGTSVEDTARAVFGRRAAHYTTSATHTDPVVLSRVVELARTRPDMTALDVGCGTGNTTFALAPEVATVVGLDLTAEMLAEAERLAAERGIDNATFEVGDAHALRFGNATFDVVVCRRAAHHFSDIATAIGEMARVLRPGGRLVVDDRSVPEDDEVDRLMQELDTLHDPSHVRQYRASEWRTMLESAGFVVDTVEPYTQHRPVTSLTDGVPREDAVRLRARLDGLDDRVRSAIDLREVDGEPHSTHYYLLAAATREG